MRLIEKKSDTIGVTVDNGALMNYVASGGQNGSIHGFELSCVDGKLYASKGMLIVQGFTIEITDNIEELVDLTSFGVPDTDLRKLYLVIEYDGTLRDSHFGEPKFVIAKSSEYVANTQIQRGISGSYYYPLCSFVNNSGSIQSFTSLVKQIILGGGSAASGGSTTTTVVNGSTIPQPVLSSVKVAKGDGPFICIGDCTFFDTIARSYHAKVAFYRKLTNARYISGSKPTIHTYKTQFVYTGALTEKTWESLTVPRISGGSTVHKRCVLTLDEIVAKFFYDGLNKRAISSSTISSNIRATRSKIIKNKRTGDKHYKHNFVELAVTIRLYNQNGSFICESPISNSIFIKPNTNVSGRKFIIKAQ